MDRRATQRRKIRQYMLDHGSITPFECAWYIRCLKLATRISEMIADGELIDSEWVEWTDEDGNKSRCKRYWLVD